MLERINEENALKEGLMEWCEGDLTAPVAIAAGALRNAGVSVEVSTETIEGAIMIAEAVNLAAKVIDDGFYELKPKVIDAAAEMGARGGWGEDGAFYLYHESVGVASFHDPWCEIGSGGEWHTPWSEVTRQELAFQLLVDENLRREVALKTSPKFSEMRKSWAVAPDFPVHLP